MPVDDIERGIVKAIGILAQRTEDLVVVTVPPIPKLAKYDNSYLPKWSKVNDTIKGSPDNISKLFVNVELTLLYFKLNCE